MALVEGVEAGGMDIPRSLTAEFLAEELHTALFKLRADFGRATAALVACPEETLDAMQSAYAKKYSEDLGKDIQRKGYGGAGGTLWQRGALAILAKGEAAKLASSEAFTGENT